MLYPLGVRLWVEERYVVVHGAGEQVVVTAAAAVMLVPVSELARFLARTLSKEDVGDEAVLRALALRLKETPSSTLFSSILTGLDHANAHRVIRLWRDTAEAQAVATSLQGTPAGKSLQGLARFKIGAPDDVEDCVLHALPGIELVHAPHVPASLPMRPNTYYFAPGPHGSRYEKLMKARALWIYMPDALLNLTLELVALTD